MLYPPEVVNSSRIVCTPWYVQLPEQCGRPLVPLMVEWRAKETMIDSVRAAVVPHPVSPRVDHANCTSASSVAW